MAEESEDWKISELASSNNYILLKQALEESPREIKKEDLDLALLRASADGYLDCVDLLLDNGADIKAVDSNLDNALMLATSSGHTSVVEMLLKRGCPPNEVNSSNFSPLLRACENGYTDIVEVLLKYVCFEDSARSFSNDSVDKANLPQKQSCAIHYIKSPRGHTPLISAVFIKSLPIVKKLLDANAPVDETDFNNCTALHKAASGTSTEILQLLLEAKADVNAKNKMDLSPLMLAIMDNRLENIRMLLRYGADISVKSRGMNVLSMAARTGTKEVIETLIEAGADFDHKDAHGCTPLFKAVQHDNYAAIRCLISFGCKFDPTNQINYFKHWEKITIFQLAIWKKNLALMKTLYAAGIYTNKILHDCFCDERLKKHCFVQPEIFENLEKIACNPTELSFLCRQVIRKSITKPLPVTIPQLNIPESIKNFLLYSDIYLIQP